MGRAKEVADRIRAEIPIVDVLYEYGYAVHPDGGDREQQFSCDLHGDGADTKPSARVYPDSASFHCFACGRSRDAITLVQEKDGVSFWEAVKGLESKYGLEPLPWSGPPEPEKDLALVKVSEALSSENAVSAEDTLARAARLIDAVCRERGVRPDEGAALWEAHDKVAYLLGESLPEEKGRRAAALVLGHVRKAMGVQDS